MDITQLTETELKALGFDLVEDLQRIQNNLVLIKNQLQELMKVKQSNSD